jgi:23S rRNA (adenine2503-C2)-methyltransferase
METPAVGETEEKPALFGRTLPELDEVAAACGLPAFAARQMADWLYKKDVTSIEAMTNLPLRARNELAERYSAGLAAPVQVQVSTDGTRKYLYSALRGRFVETAWIPDDEERGTLCVSTQVGCKMGCLFCMTGRQGFQGQLDAGQILNQFRSLPERDQVRNLVYMGMGEPLDNLPAVLASLEILTAAWGFAMSPRRITVSTIGLVPALEEYLVRSHCHLAVSLHSPFDEERRKLMPIQNVYPIAEVLSVLRAHPLEPQRRLSFEYILFRDFNDTPRHVKELARLLNGLRCRINLMRFHPLPGTPLEGSSEAAIAAFQRGLEDKGFITTVRRSRGLDIAAACGLLSTRAKTDGDRDS